MSGHSKWAQIKHKKAASDAKRGNLFSKLSRSITVAARAARADSAMNARLRMEIDRARSLNMPRDNIDRAIQKATSGKDEAALDEVLYDAYGPGGAALLIEGITDNKNRTAQEIKHIISDHGGKFAEAGAVRWMFERRGFIVLEREKNPLLTSADFELVLIDAGALDIEHDDETVVVLTLPEDREEVEKRLKEKGLEIASAEDGYSPKIKAESGENEKVEKLVEALETNDDVQNVWDNRA